MGVEDVAISVKIDVREMDRGIVRQRSGDDPGSESGVRK
jgi:hypothetical protein